MQLKDGPLLDLVLAESALELVPEALWSHPSVARSARARSKRPRDLVLEDTHHHTAMRAAATAGRFEAPERRGRPDIVHLSLLVALESRLAKEGGLRVAVHTRDDRWIDVSSGLRLQRAQHRFIGLMEGLLRDGRVPPEGKGEPLMSAESGVALVAGIRRFDAPRVLLLDETGETDESALDELLAAPGNVVAVVGGFPQGAFTSDLSALAPVRVRLGREPLAAWSVVAELVVRRRLALTASGARPR